MSSIQRAKRPAWWKKDDLILDYIYRDISDPKRHVNQVESTFGSIENGTFLEFQYLA